MNVEELKWISKNLREFQLIVNKFFQIQKRKMGMNRISEWESDKSHKNSRLIQKPSGWVQKIKGPKRNNWIQWILREFQSFQGELKIIRIIFF